MRGLMKSGIRGECERSEGMRKGSRLGDLSETCLLGFFLAPICLQKPGSSFRRLTEKAPLI